MNEVVGQGEQMIRRARNVAVGLADVGLTQAEELLRRVSPEGRAQARREREARARRQNRLLAQLALACLASLLVWVALGVVTGPIGAILTSTAVMGLLTMLIIARAAPQTPGREALVGAALPALADEATIWLAAQRRGLPAPALHLADVLTGRLDQLGPQLARVDPRETAADAIRKLIAIELPRLIDCWRAVPISLRGTPRVDGGTPNAQLIDGLRLIDAEVARVTETLARGALDEITVQRRYLELKYRGDGPSQGRDASLRPS